MDSGPHPDLKPPLAASYQMLNVLYISPAANPASDPQPHACKIAETLYPAFLAEHALHARLMKNTNAFNAW